MKLTFNDKHLVIISAYQLNNTPEENLLLHEELRDKLLNLVQDDSDIMQVSGQYNGVDEQSFAVIMPDNSYSSAWDRIQEGVIELGNEFNQICILLTFPVSETAAFFPLDAGIKIGICPDYIEHPWIEISEEEVSDLPLSTGYTKIENRYFVVDEDSDVTPTLFKMVDALFDM